MGSEMCIRDRAYDAFVINELGGVDAHGNLKPLNFPIECLRLAKST